MNPLRTHFVIPAIATCFALLSACGSTTTTSSSTTTTSLSTTTTVPAQSSTEPSATIPGVQRAAAVTTTGVAYGTVSPSQTLDLYLPATDGTTATPVVVLIHGGAFKMGNSGMEANHAKALIARGIAAASVNYRLSGEATFPAGAQDVKAAVRWLRAHAAEYGLNPNKIGAWGESAGGWMANMLGVTGDQATVFDSPDLGNADQSSAVQAVVSWYGPTNFTTMDSQANQTRCTNPDVHDSANSPESVWLGQPVPQSDNAKWTNLPAYLAGATVIPAWYLAHGDSDCQVTPGQSEELKTALEARGAKVNSVVLPGARHGDPAFDQTQLEPTVAFLATTLNS